jgi:uncharacterized protein with ATP-grasp and redox domains
MQPVLPPVLLTSEPGSFAQRTFQTRVPRIVDDLITSSDYPPQIATALCALRAEIVGGTLQLIREESDDQEFWNAQAREHLGKTWLELPWYWAEAFFYRRVLEATHYFQKGDYYCRDPFALAKRVELQPERAPRAVAAALAQLPTDTTHAFHALVQASLWGNRADLSMLELIKATSTDTSLLLVDDRARVWAFVEQRHSHNQATFQSEREQTVPVTKSLPTRAARAAPLPRVDIICDNAGTELCFDLALVDFLLRANLAAEMILHLKPQPTFVSDAMIQDALASLDAFGKSDTPALRQLAQRLACALDVGRLVLSDHPFWVTGLFFHELPNDLRATLAQASLVISKGDANYRRLIGDCHWEPTARFADAVAHFPAPIVALRTMKAELIVGLCAGAAERLRAEDAEWLVNGTHGIIQFAVSTSEEGLNR